LRRDDAVELAHATRQPEQVAPAGRDDLDDEVVLAGRDDDVVRLRPARDLVCDGLRRAGRLDADQRLLETEPERVRDPDDLQDVVIAETSVPRPYGRLGNPEPRRDRPERLPPVRLQRHDDALVQLVDSARGADGAAAAVEDGLRGLSASSTQSEAIRTTRHAFMQRPGPLELAMRMLDAPRRVAIGERMASERVAAERARYVARGVATTPLVVDRAEGARIWDVDGREYVDFAGGLGCQNTGHGFASAAIHEQVDRYLRQCFMVGMYEPYVEVCRLLDELWPGESETRSLLVNSGAEAIENAVKIARVATGRPGVIAFDHAFHGRTNLTMALTAKVVPYKDGFGPFTPDVYRAAL